MFLAGRRQNDFAASDRSFLIADLKASLTFYNIVNLVLTVVSMRRLGLARLETIDVTNEAIRAEEHSFFHLIGRELFCIGYLLEVLHLSLPSYEIENLLGYYHRVVGMQIHIESVIRETWILF